MRCHSLCMSVCLPLYVPLLSLPSPVSGFVHYSNDFACILIFSLLDDKWRSKSVAPVTPNNKSLASARKPKAKLVQNGNSCHLAFYAVFQLITVSDFDLSESVFMSIMHCSHCRCDIVDENALPHRCIAALTCWTCPTSVPGICVPVIAF